MADMKYIVLGLSLCFSIVFAQIGIGEWQSHSSYNSGNAITINNNEVYCGTLNGLYSFNTSSQVYSDHSKSEGYSEVTVAALGHSSKANATIIVYDNANVDIIKENEIINLPQIKDFTLNGDKFVYNVTILGDSAFLNCSFGVVIIDLKNQVIKNDVKFSDDIAFANVDCYDVAYFNNAYYFATSRGMYTVPYTANIKSLSNWTKLTGLPDGPFNAVQAFNNKIYFSYSRFLDDGIDNADSLFSYNGSSYGRLETLWNARIVDITSGNGNLFVLSRNQGRLINAAEVTINSFSGCFDRANRAAIQSNGDIWITNEFLGMYRINDCVPHIPDCPYSAKVWDIEVVNGTIWTASGAVDDAWNNQYSADMISYKKNNDWKWRNFNPGTYYTDPTDPISIAVNPSDDKHLFVGTWGTGLFEIKDILNTTQYLYPQLDSTSVLAGLRYRVGGVVLDKSNNCWFTNSNVVGQLRVKRANGTFDPPRDLTPYVGSGFIATDIAVDNRDQVWVNFPGKGIVIYSTKLNLYRFINNAFNNGDLPDLRIRAIQPDLDGDVWVGTHDGLRVFSSSQIFGTNPNINGQKIVLKDASGINELLLKETIINDIAIDGGNRKWIATQGNGVRLVSPDGRDIIHSFTAENSPLLSNNVNCIGIDKQTGEVYFGTDKGLISFKSDATSATESFGDVYAYPNPVKPGYDGPIAINGMAENSTVKITDVAGNLVYETISKGGTATWNGKMVDGSRPSTGVYLVFCANEDGSQNVITKILFIN